mmetsp:Transcript_95858/g.175509  ORF Transcript_95858/g.175509 Transcript_95858/m.175509 type:complete len:243 (+) Transcript_95858:791-1519(+)
MVQFRSQVKRHWKPPSSTGSRFQGSCIWWTAEASDHLRQQVLPNKAAFKWKAVHQALGALPAARLIAKYRRRLKAVSSKRHTWHVQVLAPQQRVAQELWSGGAQAESSHSAVLHLVRIARGQLLGLVHAWYWKLLQLRKHQLMHLSVSDGMPATRGGCQPTTQTSTPQGVSASCRRRQIITAEQFSFRNGNADLKHFNVKLQITLGFANRLDQHIWRVAVRTHEQRKRCQSPKNLVWILTGS